MVAADSLNEMESTVVVYVRDLNDLPPVFDTMQYIVNITEETVFVDEPLIQVQVVDRRVGGGRIHVVISLCLK